MWENSSMPEAEVCFSMRIHCWQQEWVSSVQPTVVSFPPVVQPLCCLCLSFSTSLLHPPKPECMISRPKNELFLHFWTVLTNFPPCIMPNKTYERITFFCDVSLFSSINSLVSTLTSFIWSKTCYLKQRCLEIPIEAIHFTLRCNYILP